MTHPRCAGCGRFVMSLSIKSEGLRERAMMPGFDVYEAFSCDCKCTPGVRMRVAR